MPLLRYFLYVGGALLALLILAGTYLPNSPAVETSGPQLPVIRLYADRKGPQRVVIDTSVPMPSVALARSAKASIPAEAPAAAIDVSSRVRDAFAEFQPSDGGKVQSAEQKKPEAKPAQPPRKIARRRTGPPVRMVDRQAQFGWYGPQQRFW